MLTSVTLSKFIPLETTKRILIKKHQLSIGTNFNRQNWNYQHANVNANFNQGQHYSFILSTPSGKIPGSYLKQVTLSNNNNQNYQHLSCWQFTYQL